MQLPFFADKALQTAAQYHFNIDTALAALKEMFILIGDRVSVGGNIGLFPKTLSHACINHNIQVQYVITRGKRSMKALNFLTYTVPKEKKDTRLLISAKALRA